MICSVCREKGMTSTVLADTGSTITCAVSPSWYNEDGVLVRKKSNVITTSFRCSNGHSWTKKDACY